MSTRLLTYTALFPSTSRAQHGIFIETRLKRLIQNEGIAARVVAPVPWFPSAHPRFGARAKMAATPTYDVRNGVSVHYPRYPLLPKIGMSTAPQMQAWGSRRSVARAVVEFAPQIIDAHYFYPDGVAAAAHARQHGLPLVISARGSDINLVGQFETPRAKMLAAANQASALIAVSSSLRDAMIALGMNAQKIHVLRNGIDGQQFSMQPQHTAREALGIPESAASVIVSVGNLVSEKGSDLALEAIIAQPFSFGIFAGDGALRPALEARAREAGCSARVKFLGSVAQSQLVQVYSAADVTVLASKREGWPNVVLEAMVCGSLVVASDVGAVREMVTHEGVGRVVAHSDQHALNDAIKAALTQKVDRQYVRNHALAYDWASVTRAQAALYADVAAGR